MDRVESDWRVIFEKWPQGMQRQGLVLTTFQETIPFVDFRLADEVLLVERDRPDSQGARKVMLACSSIAALKFTAPGDLSDYEQMGFVASDSDRP